MYQVIGSQTSAERASLDVGRLVRPVRLRLGLQLILSMLPRGLGLALVAAALLIALAHLTPWPDDNPLGGATGLLVAAIALIACATCVAIARAWPAEGQAVRHADRSLGLKDRLTTAREFAGRHDPMLQMQRDELGRRLRDLDLRRAVRLRFPTRDALIAAGAALLLVAALLLPNPQATARAQRLRQAAVAHHAAQRTAASIQRLQQATQQTGLRAGPNRNAQAITALLRQLQKQLLQAKTPAQALKTLASAQQQLQRLNLDSRQAQQQLAALARALANGPSASVARNIASGNSAATQQTMRALAQSLPHLSQQQQAQLARSLQQAAANTSGTLSDSLRQAAQALAQNNRGAAAKALQKAAGQIGAAQQRAATAQTTAQAQQDVSRIKQDVANGVSQDQQSTTQGSRQARQTQGSQQAGQNSRQGRQGAQQGANGQQGQQSRQGQPGANGQQAQQGASGAQQAGKGGKNAGSSSRQGGRQAAGSRGRQGQGAAQQGTGAGQTGARAPGSANGQATGAQQSNGSGHGASSVAGGSGGQGSGGQGNGGGAGANTGAGANGRYQSIYLPGQRGGGPSITTSGPMGRSVPVASRAFQQLLPQYSNAAEASMGRTSLPPDMQAQVRRYFQALEQN